MSNLKDLTTTIAALIARVEALETKVTAMESKPTKATGIGNAGRPSKASEVINNPEVNPFKGTTLESRVWEAIGAGKAITRGELADLVTERKLTTRPAKIYAYDYRVALSKNHANVAPVLTLPVDPTPATPAGTPAPVVELVGPPTKRKAKKGQQAANG